MRTPKGTTIPKKAVRKSDANKYKGPERFRATPKKKVATKPTGKKRTYLDDMPSNMKSPAGINYSEAPGAAIDTGLVLSAFNPSILSFSKYFISSILDL